MNLLIDRLPQSVVVNHLAYPINTDFRYSILFELLIMDPDLTEQEKIQQALKLYYPVIPMDLNEATEKLLWFYLCGKEPQQKGAENSGSRTAIYSFEYDDAYIYAAFMDQYHLDLQTANLHWWQFRTLFQGLKEDNQIVKIMGYRAMAITSDMTKGQKAFYTKMKQQYELPSLQLPQDETLTALEKILLGDGKVSGVL